MFLAENLLVILEDAVAGPGTHEVEVAETGGKAAANCGSRLQAELTALWEEATEVRTMRLSATENPGQALGALHLTQPR